MFELTILGNNSAAPTKMRNQSAQFLRVEDEAVLIDCGEGTQKRLIENRINYQKIKTIVISHLHGDHFLGLFGLLNTMSLNKRKSELTIVSPKGLKALYDLHIHTSDAHRSFPVNFVELEPNVEASITTKHLTIEAIPVSHRVPCFAYTFTEHQHGRPLNVEACQRNGVPVEAYNDIKAGADFTNAAGTVISNSELTYEPKKATSYGYITDTEVLFDLASRFSACETLYHEATYLHTLLDRAQATKHSTAKQAAQFASKASVNQLLIGHFSSRYNFLDQHLEEAKTYFENTLLAEEGQSFTIG